MMRPISLLFLLGLIIIGDSSINIRTINSAAYIPTDFSNVISYNGTCSKCICFAFVLSTAFTYEALNCYMNNNTCLLFGNFLSRSYVRINTNSKLYFLPLPTYTTAASCGTINDICNGSSWDGLTNCCGDLSCVYFSPSYSYCLLTVNNPTTISSLGTVAYVDDTRQNATSGTYWDCCKTSCSWPYKATVTGPPPTCQQDGVTTIDSNTASICNSGSAYACTNQQPWNVSSNLSYGYAGAGLTGEGESDWCCACYSLVFTTGPIVGKEMIVQVINTAYPANNIFTLQIPGGGWGGSANGCLSQFNGSYAWGQQYGGVSNRSDCANLPNVLQPGCYWRFDWFMNANNPQLKFKQVSCPSVLINTTGCIRQ